MSRQQILDQLRQPSTWRGLVLLVSSLGVAIRPDVGEALIAAGLALSGLIGVLTSDAVPPAE